jgi:hypothetical protein
VRVGAPQFVDIRIDDNILTLGNGAGDAVSADLSSYVKITLGNGINDFVSADNSSFDTIILGNGAGDTVNVSGAPPIPNSHNQISLGNGAGDTVNALGSANDTITLGNGNNDIVMASQTTDSQITVGNSNDTIYVGSNNTVTVGTGHDSFIFEQTTPGNIGAATITGFGPNKDGFTFSNQLTTSVSYHDNAQGNAVITVDNSGDTITLEGVHASELHPSNFHFVDPAAVPAIATTAQMVADLHAHSFLL